MWDQLQEAGAADIIFSTIGTAAFKLGAIGARGIYRAYDLALQGNQEGAYRSLKELMHLDDEQVDEIIKGWENLAGREVQPKSATARTLGLPALRSTKALEIIPRTTPGGEAIVQPAAALDPVASANAAKEIDTRAKQIHDQSETSSSENISTILRDEAKTYKDNVKQVYTGVKEFGIQEMEGSSYRFDYSKLAIDPILERAVSELTNPALRDRALAYMQRIRHLGGITVDVPTITPVTKKVVNPR